ncbi:MAG: alpha-amylase family glycosyl hydrolase [Promethearchaeota archaeon]
MYEKNPVIIYNLFPPLAGKISKWEQNLHQIAEMGFTWIYINPINQRGFSNSLYSIKNYFLLDSAFADSKNDQQEWNSFIEFVRNAHKIGLKVMLDIVINHTAVDAVSEHPNWYKYKWVLRNRSNLHPVRIFEEILKSEINYDKNRFPPENFELVYIVAPPYAINPVNTNDIQIWGDLAEINFNEPYLPEILEFFKKYLKFCIDLGVDGFRADAAYQVPGTIWKEFIEFCKEVNPEVIFWAETLGGNYEQHVQLMNSGFDFITNSSKWWDFTAPWCVEQHEEYAKIAPSISFPETHDTPRLAAESGGRKDVQVFRYLFASFFSEGLMMPIGYELGATERLSVIMEDFTQMGQTLFDIRQDIQKINTFKKKYPGMMDEGKLYHYPYENLGVLILKKEHSQKHSQLLLIYNKDWHNAQKVDLPDIREILSYQSPIFQIDIKNNQKRLDNFKITTWLPPNHFLLYYQLNQDLN